MKTDVVLKDLARIVHSGELGLVAYSLTFSWPDARLTLRALFHAERGKGVLMPSEISMKEAGGRMVATSGGSLDWQQLEKETFRLLGCREYVFELASEDS